MGQQEGHGGNAGGNRSSCPPPPSLSPSLPPPFSTPSYRKDSCVESPDPPCYDHVIMCGTALCGVRRGEQTEGVLPDWQRTPGRLSAVCPFVQLLLTDAGELSRNVLGSNGFNGFLIWK